MVDTAIFLLAGESSRFNGIVEHKCLLKIAGQTLLERQIIQSANLGIRDFVFAVGAANQAVCAEMVRILRGIPISSWAVVYNLDYKITKNGHTLWLCRHRLGDTTLIWEGDVVSDYTPYPYDSFSTWFIVPGYTGDGSYIREDTHDCVLEQGIFQSRPTGWTKSAGIFYLIGHPAFRDQERGDLIDEIMVRSVSKIKEIPFHRWHEIDTVEDFACAKKKFTQPVKYQVDPALI